MHKTDRVAVVLNGNARQVTDELVESFDQLIGSGDLFLSRSLDEAHGIALNIVESGYRGGVDRRRRRDLRANGHGHHERGAQPKPGATELSAS